MSYILPTFILLSVPRLRFAVSFGHESFVHR